MKTKNSNCKKPNKIKELYDQMQAEKNPEHYAKQGVGSKGKSPKGGKLQSRPRSIAK